MFWGRKWNVSILVVGGGRAFTVPDYCSHLHLFTHQSSFSRLDFYSISQCSCQQCTDHNISSYIDGNPQNIATFHCSRPFVPFFSPIKIVKLLMFHSMLTKMLTGVIVHTSDCSNALLSTSFQACLWLLAGGKYRKQSPLHHQIRVIHWLVNQWREKRDTRDTAWQSAPSPPWENGKEDFSWSFAQFTQSMKRLCIDLKSWHMWHNY